MLDCFRMHEVCYMHRTCVCSRRLGLSHEVDEIIDHGTNVVVVPNLYNVTCTQLLSIVMM